MSIADQPQPSKTPQDDVAIDLQSSRDPAKELDTATDEKAHSMSVDCVFSV